MTFSNYTTLQLKMKILPLFIIARSHPFGSNVRHIPNNVSLKSKYVKVITRSRSS